MTMQYELYHHGILGMKWGIRRYQNKDGTLTAAGKKRYSSANLTDEDRKEFKKWAENNDSELGRSIYNNILSEAKNNDKSEVSKIFKEAVSLQESLNKIDDEFFSNDKLVRKALKEYNENHDDKYTYESLSYASPATNVSEYYYEKHNPNYKKMQDRLWDLRGKYASAVDEYFKNAIGAKHNSVSKISKYSKYGYKRVSSIAANVAVIDYFADIFDKKF